MTSQPSTGTAGGAGLDIDHHLGVLRRRWITVLLVLLLVVGATAYVTSEQTPQYRASVEFVVGTLIDPSGSAGQNSDNDLLAQVLSGNSRLETQTAAIESAPIAERAAIVLGTDRSPQSLLNAVEASLTQQQVLVVSATSTDAQEAVAIANAFVDAYLGARSDEAITRLLTAQERVQSRFDDATREIAELTGQITALLPVTQTDPETGEQVRIDPTTGDILEFDPETGEIIRIDATTGEVIPDTPFDDPLEEDELNSLLAARQEAQSRANGLEQQLTNLDTTGTLQSAGGQIIRPAVVPTEPFSPQPIRNIGLALVLGLTLGLGLAYLRDHLDDAIRSDSDVAKLVGRPILGRIPKWDHADRGRLITVAEPASPIAESFRTLRTNVRFLSTGGKIGSVLVTSPAVGEGKTTTAANLAVAFAKLGTRVMLVDADLRRPNVDNAFSTARTPGLSEVLVGEVEAAHALQDVGIPNLRVLPAGTIPPNPSELLGSTAMIGLIEEFEAIADLVIVDAPPLLAVSDAIGLSAGVTHTILVMEQGSTGRSAVRAAVQQLANVDTQVAGVVLNAITESDGGYQYQYYYREYTADLDEKGRKRRDRVKTNDADAADGFTSNGGLSRRERRAAEKADR